MGNVTINLSPGFGPTGNVFSWDISAPVSLAELLEGWASGGAPEELKSLLSRETGTIPANVLILLNGLPVKAGELETTTVSPGDSIYIAPVLLGG